MNESLFEGGQVTRFQRPQVDRVGESVSRINFLTRKLEPGFHGSLVLSPYKQQEGTTCFFSGPIAVARDFRGLHVDEHMLAGTAREYGLLDQFGARTTEDAGRIGLEVLVEDLTSVAARFNQPSWGEALEDAQLLDILIRRGNVASVLYPLSADRNEWETFYGVSKREGEEGVRWHSNFSPAGVLRERTTPEMAQLLYGNPENPYILICELEVQTPLPPESPLFEPA